MNLETIIVEGIDELIQYRALEPATKEEDIVELKKEIVKALTQLNR